MANPNPKPTAIKLAEGNASKQKLSAKEPKAGDFKHTAPPDWMTDEAKAIWSEILPEFKALDLLQGVDLDEFAAYCNNVALSRRLPKEIAAEGGETMTLISKGGQPYSQTSAKYQAYHQAVMRMMKLGAQFGDSPSARARLGRLLDDDKDELDAYLDGKPE